MKDSFKVKGFSFKVKDGCAEVSFVFKGKIDGMTFSGRGEYGTGESSDLCVHIFEPTVFTENNYEYYADTIWQMIDDNRTARAWMNLYSSM
jgi:hypothetical protein